MAFLSHHVKFPQMSLKFKNRLTSLLWALTAAAALASMGGCSGGKITPKGSTHLSTPTKGKTSTSKVSNQTKGNTGGSSSSSSSSAKKTTGKVEKGQASYYADKFHGRATASGEKYDKRKMTGAHRTLPFGSVVRVTNTANGKSVDVRINDRGPFKAGRIVDVSRAAAEKLGMIQAGVINCTMEVISTP